jgi:hypothetical protein
LQELEKEELVKSKAMRIEETKDILKTWNHEILQKYSTHVVSKYEEPINIEQENIFLLDVVLKRNAQLDNYGFVLGVRIFKVEPTKFELTVDICEGAGKIIKGKTWIIEDERLPIENKVYDSIYKCLIEYKALLFKLVDQEIKTYR